MSSVAAVLAVTLAFAPPPPAPPVASDSDAAEPVIPDPTIVEPTAPGAPKRVGLPSSGKDPVARPTPVEPTPVKPVPVLPTGPQPILPGTDPDEHAQSDSGSIGEVRDEPRQARRRERRPRREPRGSFDGAVQSGACLAAQSRCRMFVAIGLALGATGLGLGAGGAVLVTRPQTPLRDDPTMVESLKPPGAVMLAVGSGLVVTGIAILAAGVASHRRDQAARRRSALWRAFGVSL